MLNLSPLNVNNPSQNVIEVNKVDWSTFVLSGRSVLKNTSQSFIITSVFWFPQKNLRLKITFFSAITSLTNVSNYLAMPCSRVQHTSRPFSWDVVTLAGVSLNGRPRNKNHLKLEYSCHKLNYREITDLPFEYCTHDESRERNEQLIYYTKFWWGWRITVDSVISWQIGLRARPLRLNLTIDHADCSSLFEGHLCVVVTTDS